MTKDLEINIGSDTFSKWIYGVWEHHKTGQVTNHCCSLGRGLLLSNERLDQGVSTPGLHEN